MALACENIEEQLADAEAKGHPPDRQKPPRKGAEGMTIAFLHPKSTQGILTELCENKNNSVKRNITESPNSAKGGTEVPPKGGI